jgi:hypothetical protein
MIEYKLVIKIIFIMMIMLFIMYPEPHITVFYPSMENFGHDFNTHLRN